MGKKAREKREMRETRFYQGSGGQQGGEIKKPEKKTPEVSFLLNLIRWGVYLALLTPLIVSGEFFFPFVAPKTLYFMGLAQIIFALWLILIISTKEYRPKFNNPLLLVIIFFVAILALSTIFGADPSRSFWSNPERMTGLLTWFHLLAFFLVISSVFQKKRDWQRIFAVSISVGLILSLIALFSEDPVMRGGATIGSDSFLGTYLIFTLFLALYLIFIPSEKVADFDRKLAANSREHFLTRLTFQKGLKIYSGICFLIIFLTLLLSDARAAKLSFLGGLALLFFLYLIFIPKKVYLNILGTVFLLASVIAFFFGAFLLFQPESFVQEKFIEKVTRARLVVWEGSWKGFFERPLLGWGPENFEFVFARHFNPCLFLPECGGEVWFDRAHNVIFDTLITGGIFGFLAYLGIFLAAFYVLWQKYFQKAIDFWAPAIFSVLFISYFVQNLTVFDMISSYLMFFLVLGFISSMVTPKETVSPPKIVSLKLWTLPIILILFIFSFYYFVIQPLRTTHYVIAALRSPPASEERLNFYQKTLETSSFGKYQIRNFFAQLTFDFVQTEKIEEVSLEDLKREMDFVIKELEKSIKESPLDFRSHLKLGQLYGLYEGKILEAERVLEKAIELSPTNQQGYWALAQIKFYQNKNQEALSLTKKALELEPRLAQSHLIVIRLAKTIGDEDLARKKAKEAIEIVPHLKPYLEEILEVDR